MPVGSAVAFAGTCFWRGVPFPPTALVTSCLDDLPFNTSWRDGTVATIKEILPNYVLSDVLTNTGPPANIRVDLEAALGKIASTDFDRDSDMQSAFANLFLGLHDAHTVYKKPQAYANIQYTQPYTLEVKLDGSEMKIFFGAEAVPGVLAELPDEFGALTGMEVLSINGVDPIAAISDWADINDYSSLDQGARFSHVLRTGTFVSRRVYLYDIPREPMEYVLLSAADPFTTVSLSVPWTAAAISSSVPVDISVAACSKDGDRSGKPIAGHHLLVEDDLPEPKGALSEDWVLESSTPPLSMYTSRDGSTAVMKLTSFSPDDVSAYCANMESAWDLMAMRGVQNLIIDVIGNGGGYVCFGYDLVRLLTPATLIDAPADVYGAPYDLKWSEKMSKALRAGVTNKSAYHELGMDSWLDENTLEVVDPAEFYDNGPSYLRGTVADSRHSQKFFLNCATDDFEGVCELKKPKITFSQDHVLVLTDGYCGSTCATFMHRLQAGPYAKVAGVGGIKNVPLASSSFAGGFTAHLSTLNSLFLEEDRIPEFPTNGGLGGFAWAEVYDKERPTVPAQYAYRQTDFRLDFWDFNGPLGPLYDMAKATFPNADSAPLRFVV